MNTVVELAKTEEGLCLLIVVITAVATVAIAICKTVESICRIHLQARIHKRLEDAKQ